MTTLIDGAWLPVKDGDPRIVALYERHYSARPGLPIGQRRKWGISGPGESLCLLTVTCDALFVWRAERFRKDKQQGINCAVFRNEGAILSSTLVKEACELAWVKWPGERLYTFVDPIKTRHKRDPGRCFIKAGWRRCGTSAEGLVILEILKAQGEVRE